MCYYAIKLTRYKVLKDQLPLLISVQHDTIITEQVKN